MEQQTAMEYGVPSFVVADEMWASEQGFILNDMQRVTSAYTKDNKR